jgi:N-acylneuraminate cytidylyltransferase/CMP-N,N'-diacetyllegionaminic acid synthase
MYKNKTFLAIIPARSGSKGLVDKNIKLMNGKPLVSYTIEASIESKLFDKILVSTDSKEYAKIAKGNGASVPFLRPKELALDETTTYEVILHVLEKLEGQGEVYDYFMLLQPTSPLRDKNNICESVEALFEKRADTVVSICESESKAFLNVKLNKEGELEKPPLRNEQTRRQDMVKEYRINGAIYLTNTVFFKTNKGFYSGKTYPIFMDKRHSVDIDDNIDFRLAEILMKEQSYEL